MGGQLITPGYWGQGNTQGSGQLIQPFANTGSGNTLINPYLPSSQVSFQFWQKPVYQASDGTYWCPGFDGPVYASNPWDYVYINSTPTPGVAEVMVRKQRAFDKKKPAGSDGARTTIHGLEPADIEIRLLIWTPEQLRQLIALWPVLLTRPYKTTIQTTTQTVFANVASGSGTSQTTTTATVSGGNVSTTTVPLAVTTTQVTKKNITTPVTFDVQHPLFDVHSIKSIQIIGGSGPEPGPVARARIFTIRALEFLPPKGGASVTATPTQSKGSLLDAPAYPTPGTNPASTGP